MTTKHGAPTGVASPGKRGPSALHSGDALNRARCDEWSAQALLRPPNASVQGGDNVKLERPGGGGVEEGDGDRSLGSSSDAELSVISEVMVRRHLS
jgi:hypothetical protein